MASIIACANPAASDPLITIFPASATQAVALHEWTAPFWEPSNRQISKLELALPEYLLRNSPIGKIPSDNFKSYGRQYFGISQNGKKLIYLNAFCDPERFARRKTDLVRVLDGGSCYFHVLYDPETKTFSDVNYNGEA